MASDISLLDGWSIGDCSGDELVVDEIAADVVVAGDDDIDAASWDVQGDGSSSSSSSHDNVLARVDAGARGRGRPLGQFGRPEHQRRLREQLAAQAQIEVLHEQLVTARNSRRARTETGSSSCTLALFMRQDVADECQRLIAHCVSRGIIPDDPDVCQLADHCFGPIVQPSGSISSESRLLGVSRFRFGDRVEEIAAITYWGYRAYTEGIASFLMRSFAEGWTPVAIVSFEQYDETPMHVRAGSRQASSSSNSTELISAYSGTGGKDMRRGSRTSGTTKLMQVASASLHSPSPLMLLHCEASPGIGHGIVFCQACFGNRLCLISEV